MYCMYYVPFPMLGPCGQMGGTPIIHRFVVIVCANMYYVGVHMYVPLAQKCAHVTYHVF